MVWGSYEGKLKSILDVLDVGFSPYLAHDGNNIETQFISYATIFHIMIGGSLQVFDLAVIDGHFGGTKHPVVAGLYLHKNNY